MKNLVCLNILKNFPFRPKVRYKRKLIVPRWTELWAMYNKSDYVARTVNQVLDGPNDGFFKIEEVLEFLYIHVHERLNYVQLSEVIRLKIRDMFFFENVF